MSVDYPLASLIARWRCNAQTDPCPWRKFKFERIGGEARPKSAWTTGGLPPAPLVARAHLCARQVGTKLVAVSLIRLKQSAKMPFAKDGHVDQDSPADRADDPLRVSVQWRHPPANKFRVHRNIQSSMIVRLIGDLFNRVFDLDFLRNIDDR